MESNGNDTLIRQFYETASAIHKQADAGGRRFYGNLTFQGYHRFPATAISTNRPISSPNSSLSTKPSIKSCGELVPSRCAD